MTQVLQNLLNHDFGMHDSRSFMLQMARQDDFRRAISPRLEKLAPCLSAMREYISVEWLGWSSDNLPPDHAHEAFKRILLEAIIMLEIEGPIPIEKEWKNIAPKWWEHIQVKSYPTYSSKQQSISPAENQQAQSLRKRTHNDDDDVDERRTKSPEVEASLNATVTFEEVKPITQRTPGTPPLEPRSLLARVVPPADMIVSPVQQPLHHAPDNLMSDKDVVGAKNQ